jgi:putative ABC transport system ATP-binding protein
MLDAKGISKTFNIGTINEKSALNGVSLKLEKGEFATVIGGNGAGKSTLLSAIAGVYSIDSGSICVDGNDVTHFPEHRRAKYIGRVFQDPSMGTASNMEIQENLALAARRGKFRGLRWGVTSSERAGFREKLSTLGLGLENRLTTKVGLLSGGQRQALTLLMATYSSPSLLLLDEHTAALDPKTAAKVLELSDGLIRENNLTTLMVTHNMHDAIAHGDRLIMMYEGRIIIDIRGEAKQRLTPKDLLDKFEELSGSKEADSDLLLG